MDWVLIDPSGNEQYRGSYWQTRDLAEEAYAIVRRFAFDETETAPKVTPGWMILPEAMVDGISQ